MYEQIRLIIINNLFMIYKLNTVQCTPCTSVENVTMFSNCLLYISILRCFAVPNAVLSMVGNRIFQLLSECVDCRCFIQW